MGGSSVSPLLVFSYVLLALMCRGISKFGWPSMESKEGKTVKHVRRLKDFSTHDSDTLLPPGCFVQTVHAIFIPISCPIHPPTWPQINCLP